MIAGPSKPKILMTVKTTQDWSCEQRAPDHDALTPPPLAKSAAELLMALRAQPLSADSPPSSLAHKTKCQHSNTANKPERDDR
jgi:hypothetical protein